MNKKIKQNIMDLYRKIAQVSERLDANKLYIENKVSSLNREFILMLKVFKNSMSKEKFDKAVDKIQTTTQNYGLLKRMKRIG